MARITMEENKFRQLMETVKVVRSMDPAVNIERFLASDLTSSQKQVLVEEFSKKTVKLDQSMVYGYYENDYF